MATKVDELYVDVGARVKGYQQAMDSVANKARDVGSRMQEIGGQLSAFITLPLAGVGAAALKTASEVEEMQAKFTSVFGDLAGEAEAFARRHADATGRASDALMGYMAQLQDTFVPMGVARDEAADMSKTLTALAVDVASFNNENPDEAVNRFTSALVGNHAAVREYGIVMTQATLESELLAMGIEGGIQAASEQEKMLARMNVMLESTRDAQGDAQRTAGSFANQMRALKADVRELTVELGQMLMPAAKTLVGLTRELTQRFKNLDQSQKDLIVRLGVLAAVIPPLIVAFGTLIKIGGTVVAAFKAIGTVVALAAAKITAPVVAAVAAVVTLGTAAWMIVQNWEDVKAWMGDFWESVRGLASTGSEMIVQLFKGIWPRVEKFMRQGIAKVYDIVGRFFEWIGAERQADALAEFGERFRGLVPEDAIEENNQRLAESADRFADYKDDVVESGEQAAQGVQSAFQQMWDTVSGVRDIFSVGISDFGGLGGGGAGGESEVDFETQGRTGGGAGGESEVDFETQGRTGGGAPSEDGATDDRLGDNTSDQLVGVPGGTVMQQMQEVNAKRKQITEAALLSARQVGETVARTATQMASQIGSFATKLFSVHDGFESMHDAAKAFGKIFTSALKNIVKQLTTAIAKMTIMKGLLAIFPGFGDFASGLLGIGGGGGAGTVVGGVGLTARAGSIELQGQTRLSGQDLLISYNQTARSNGRL